MKAVKCKNCIYFGKPDDPRDSVWRNCGCIMIESYTDSIAPKPNTKMIIRVSSEKALISIKVHKEWGCIEGIAKNEIDRRRGR